MDGVSASWWSWRPGADLDLAGGRWICRAIAVAAAPRGRRLSAHFAARPPFARHVLERDDGRSPVRLSDQDVQSWIFHDLFSPPSRFLTSNPSTVGPGRLISRFRRRPLDNSMKRGSERSRNAISTSTCSRSLVLFRSRPKRDDVANDRARPVLQ